MLAIINGLPDGGIGDGDHPLPWLVKVQLCSNHALLFAVRWGTPKCRELAEGNRK